MNIAKINKRVLEEAVVADEVYQKLVMDYAKKDEAGKLVPHEGREGSFVIPDEVVPEWLEKLKEFKAITFDIDRPRIAFADVQVAAQMSPADAMALEPFWEDASEEAELRAVE